MKWRPSPVWVARLFGPVLSLLARTWRVEVRAEGRWRSLATGGGGYIFLLWHEALLPLLWKHRHQGIAIVVSEANDGRYLAEYARRIGYRCLSGSSTRGGVRALVGAMKALEQGIPVAFTPDGPRGPRREVKPGMLAAAVRTGRPILPIHAEADRAWRLRSWDRFMIPKPFARVRIGYGEPFGAGPETGPSLVSAALHAVEQEIAWQHVGATATA